MTSAAKSNEKLVNEKLCNTVLILNALYINLDKNDNWVYHSKYAHHCRYVAK